MAQRVKSLPAEPNSEFQPAWWKEGTNSHKRPSDFHMGIVAHIPHPHPQM